MQIIDYISLHPWAFFGILSSLGAYFNKDNSDGLIMCFLASTSVSLGIIINNVADYFISEHITYTMYAISDSLIALCVYRVAQRNRRYHAITVLFFMSILTHLTFQFFLLIKDPMLSDDYFAIMVILNSLIVLFLMGFSNGFAALCRFFLRLFNRVLY